MNEPERAKPAWSKIGLLCGGMAGFLVIFYCFHLEAFARVVLPIVNEDIRAVYQFTWLVGGSMSLASAFIGYNVGRQFEEWRKG
jgi:hypothetical protein